MTSIAFEPTNVPRSDIYEYAKHIKQDYPKIWEMGDREKSDEVFAILSKVSERGFWEEDEIVFYKKWLSYIARHQHDYRIVGVVSMLKYLGEIDHGFDFMKSMIEKEIKQQYRG